MKTLIFILPILLFIHFVYEMILVPILHRVIRYRLFAIRDKLRYMNYEGGKGIDQAVFDLLQNYTNNLISFLPNISIYFLTRVEKFISNNPHVINEISEKVKLLDKCDDKQILSIQNDLMKTFSYIIAVNNGLFALYFLPIVVFIAVARFLIKKSIGVIQQTLYISEDELNSIMPNVSFPSHKHMPLAKAYTSSCR